MVRAVFLRELSAAIGRLGGASLVDISATNDADNICLPPLVGVELHWRFSQAMTVGING